MNPFATDEDDDSDGDDGDGRFDIADVDVEGEGLLDEQKGGEGGGRAAQERNVGIPSTDFVDTRLDRAPAPASASTPVFEAAPSTNSHTIPSTTSSPSPPVAPGLSSFGIGIGIGRKSFPSMWPFGSTSSPKPSTGISTTHNNNVTHLHHNSHNSTAVLAEPDAKEEGEKEEEVEEGANNFSDVQSEDEDEGNSSDDSDGGYGHAIKSFRDVDGGEGLVMGYVGSGGKGLERGRGRGKRRPSVTTEAKRRTSLEDDDEEETIVAFAGGSGGGDGGVEVEGEEEGDGLVHVAMKECDVREGMERSAGLGGNGDGHGVEGK